MEDRRYKYAKNNPIKNKDLKIDIKFDISELDLFCNYVCSSNKCISKGSMINLRNVFLLLDMNNYMNDTDRMARIDFIMKGLDARINYNLTDSLMILSHINGGLGVDSSNIFKELSNFEIKWVEESISSILKDSILYNDIDKGLELFTKFKATEYRNRGPIIKEIELFITQLNNKFRKIKVQDTMYQSFSLKEDVFTDCIRQVYRQIISPSNRLLFGTQALNLLTGGGLESGRVYVLLGLPGEGKSSTLLDMAIQLKRYNKNYVCKDPTKRPCVVLLIMENGIKETVQRLFNMCIGTEMSCYTEDEVIDMLINKGGMVLSQDDPIDIIIKFRPNLSEDTSYLYTATEDLEDDGYEVICFLQDYLKRIRSIEGNFNGDTRSQYGAIINEFKVFATIKDIPVVTASQLNRTATDKIDTARIKNKADLVRLIGRSNVGESNLILENSDWICLLAPEYDKNKIKYLGMQVVKSRYYIPDNNHVAYIPYINGTIKFIEDFYDSKPVHKTSLREEPMFNNGINSAQGLIGEIKQFSEYNNIKLPQDESNMFLNASGFATKNMLYYQPPLVEMCKFIG